MPAGLYPDIDFHLNFTPYSRFNLFKDRGGWNGRRGSDTLHLSEDEVARWKSRIDFDAVDLLYLYGFGVGRYWETLREWLEAKPSRALVVLEDDLGALAALYQLKGAREMLAHPRLHLRYIPSQKSWERVLEQLASEFSCDKIEVAALESRRQRPFFRKLKLDIHRKTTLWHAALSEAIYSHLFFRNVLENMKRLPNSFCLNRLRGKFKSIPAVICGAGPSLQKAVPHLKQLDDKALIFAGGSTLSALAHFKVKPHFGLAVDPNPREYDCVKGCTFRSIPFLYASRLLPKVFELFDGPFGYIRSGTGGSCEAYFEKAVGIKDEFIGPELGREALSVTTLAVAIATALGCDPIIFVGLDMAYTDDKPYASGVLAPPLTKKTHHASDALLRRKGVDGKLVYTTVKWVMESDTLSAFAKAHSDHRFVNATEGGLGLRTIPNLPFKEVVAAHCINTHPLRQKIAKEIKRAKLDIATQQMNRQFNLLLKSLKRCLKLVDEIVLAPESPKAIVLEMDLQEEVAFEPLLASVAPAFTLGVRNRFIYEGDDKKQAFEKAKWNHVRECIVTHLETISACCVESEP